MDKKLVLIAALSVVLALAGGCNRGGSADNQSKQTRFPGQVSAGGGTSGEVMARNSSDPKNPMAPSGTPGIPQGSGGNTGGAAMGGTSGATGGSTGGQPAAPSQPAGGYLGGTPRVPEGSGGNTSGAAMGGTTSGAAATQEAPAASGMAPAPNTSSPGTPPQGKP